MSGAELRATASRLERELEEVREQLRREHSDPSASTAELVRSRAYAFDAAAPLEGMVATCADSLSRYGFCVVDGVIPENQRCVPIVSVKGFRLQV